MDRYNKANGVNIAPSAPPAADHPYYTAGDPQNDIPATTPGPWLFHMLIESLRNVIVAAGMTPDHTNLNLLTNAIKTMIASGDYKASCRVATTAAINLAAPGANIDGIAMAAGNRVLVKDQAALAQNGLYTWNGAAVAMTRTADADDGAELNSGAIVAIEEGAINADSQWMFTTDGTITIGATDLTLKQVNVSTAATSKIQSITATVVANALTLGLNPTVLDFRAASLTNGVANTRSVNAALSLVVPSGATLGTINGQSARLLLLAIDNLGTVELAVVNLAGGVNLDETTLINTTAISAASTASNVVYSTTARAGVPLRVVGSIDITEAAAGTWATAPTAIQGSGGQALTSLSSLGFGQIMQVVTRTNGVTYYNTTGRPIAIGGYSSANTASSCSCSISINGGAAIVIGGAAMSTTGTNPGAFFAIVPAGASYVVTDSGGGFAGRTTWELR